MCNFLRIFRVSLSNFCLTEAAQLSVDLYDWYLGLIISCIGNFLKAYLKRCALTGHLSALAQSYRAVWDEGRTEIGLICEVLVFPFL